MSLKNCLKAILLQALVLLNFQVARASDAPDIGLYADDTALRVSNQFQPGSHVKLFLPNLPYLAISHAINAALVRPAGNARGWQYDLAKSHHSIDDKTWQFELRRGVRFQDGSAFDANSVLSNMRHFQRQPSTFSKLHTILDRVEKVDDYTVRFHLTEAYGAFINDAMWLQFYTAEYLAKFGWNGKPTCPNLAEPGLYALGPYILHEGYIEGDRRSKKAVLKANALYWGEDKPKVETITIYSEFGMDKARDSVLEHEGIIDISPVKFADLTATVLSPYAKLAISPSLNNYAMHINLINGHKALTDARIRFVINHAIDQEYLLNLAMLGEGVLSPTMVSPNFYKVDEAIDLLDDYFAEFYRRNDTSTEALKAMVQQYQKQQGLDPQQPLQLTLLAQKSFLFLIRDIQYFLAQVNIDLKVEILATEQQVFHQLHGTWKQSNEKPWDLLLWGNYDWFKHPWSAFFVYNPANDWSTIPANKTLKAYTEQLFSINADSDRYVPFLAEYLRYLFEQNLMVFLPTPNNVYAVNKELAFKPGRSAFVYLRDLQVTPDHWSLRTVADYPLDKQRPLSINRQTIQEPSK
ncbi:MAG: ABC transporter substrate-binding protein [Pseudomonadales bacterium]|nr:ABC transporter substrate-binding protein [Pseudomonadales bacterium]